MQTIKESDLTTEWIARTGLQSPVLVKHSASECNWSHFLSNSLDASQLELLEALGKTLGMLDKEVKEGGGFRRLGGGGGGGERGGKVLRVP